MTDDLISRQAVLEALRTCYDTELVEYENGAKYIRYDQAVDSVEELPSAQHKQKTGKWIRVDNYGQCSECRVPVYPPDLYRSYKFCPDCGAKMEARE